MILFFAAATAATFTPLPDLEFESVYLAHYDPYGLDTQLFELGRIYGAASESPADLGVYLPGGLPGPVKDIFLSTGPLHMEPDGSWWVRVGVGLSCCISPGNWDWGYAEIRMNGLFIGDFGRNSPSLMIIRD